MGRPQEGKTMKTLTINSILAVAALAVAAGNAAAQTYKVDIPMAFTAQNAVMAPGSYEFHIVRSSGQPLLAMRNVASNSSMTLLAFPGSDVPTAWRAGSRPLIGFVCYGRTCSLRSLWDGHDTSTIQLPLHKLPAAEAERASVVTLALARAD
jgi:hypothetical protein